MFGSNINFFSRSDCCQKVLGKSHSKPNMASPHQLPSFHCQNLEISGLEIGNFWAGKLVISGLEIGNFWAGK
jgi:hypothetical protein